MRVLDTSHPANLTSHQPTMSCNPHNKRQCPFVYVLSKPVIPTYCHPLPPTATPTEAANPQFHHDIITYSIQFKPGYRVKSKRLFTLHGCTCGTVKLYDNKTAIQSHINSCAQKHQTASLSSTVPLSVTTHNNMIDLGWLHGPMNTASTPLLTPHTFPLPYQPTHQSQPQTLKRTYNTSSHAAKIAVGTEFGQQQMDIGYGKQPQKMSFSSPALPASLSTYQSFVETFAESRGTCLQYSRHPQHKDRWILHGNNTPQKDVAQTHRSNKQRTTCNKSHVETGSSVEHHLGNNISISVKQWDNWYQHTFLPRLFPLSAESPQWDNIDDVFYLADIIVDNLVHKQLTKSFPSTIGRWQHTGPTCLNQYINDRYPDVRIPDATSRLYLSPPVPGFIVTPAHLDGHGRQMSTHMVMFGGQHCYNKVYSWTPQQIGSSRRMDMFRHVMGVAPTCTKQHLPHSQRFEYIVPGSPSADQQDASIQHAFDPSRLHQLEQGAIFGDVLDVGPHETVTLPAGTFHLFVKCMKQPQSISASTLEPMLGYAGDNTYIGSGTSIQEMRYNITNMLDVQEQLRVVSQPVIAYIELGIFVLFNSSNSYYETSPYTQLVKQALRPLYDAIIESERAALAEHVPPSELIDTLNDSFDEDIRDNDYFCYDCNMGIVNLFAYSLELLPRSSDATGQTNNNNKRKRKEPKQRRFYCRRCFPTHMQQQDVSLAFLYRFSSAPSV